MTAEPEVHAPVHVRVRGWCDRCGGIGKQSVQHVDAPAIDVPAAIGAARDIVAAATTRLVELAGAGHGCEAAAETARCEGRLEAARQVLEALGVDVGAQPPPPPAAPNLRPNRR